MAAGEFSLFVGVDFSGARGPALPGLQVAVCRPGRAAPRLVACPGGGHWTRTAFADWLGRRLQADRPVLCGLDFAFALPYDGRYLPRSGLRAGTARALWRRVDERPATAPPTYTPALFPPDSALGSSPQASVDATMLAVCAVLIHTVARPVSAAPKRRSN